MKDRDDGQKLAYPEAVLLTRPSNPQFKGEVTINKQVYALFLGAISTQFGAINHSYKFDFKKHGNKFMNVLCCTQVDDKYQYSVENQYNQVNGWITADSEKPVGFWIITPSNEFRNGGPVKQDLTSHVGPICLSVSSTHVVQSRREIKKVDWKIDFDRL